MWFLAQWQGFNPEVIAAFFAGGASIVGGTFAVKRARREEHEACAERLKEQREAYERGIDRGLKMRERDA